jgi:uncharacterized membrane protein YfcA
MTTYLILALILFVSAGVQGVLGFGFGMLSMSFVVVLFPAEFPMKQAVPLVTGYALLANAFLVYRLRDSVVLGGLRPILLGGFIGVPIGVMLLKRISEGPLLLTLGGVMIVHVLWTLRQADPSALDLGRLWAVVAGCCAGALGASLGTAGPPVVMYGSTKPWDKNQLRGTIQAFFLFCCVVQMTLYVVPDDDGKSLMSMELLRYNVVLAPVVALGGLLGLRMSRRVNQEVFRMMVLGGLFLLSLSFVRRGLIAVEVL